MPFHRTSEYLPSYGYEEAYHLQPKQATCCLAANLEDLGIQLVQLPCRVQILADRLVGESASFSQILSQKCRGDRDYDNNNHERDNNGLTEAWRTLCAA
jgi:hypothetical protein